jgi:hypothetical protein
MTHFDETSRGMGWLKNEFSHSLALERTGYDAAVWSSSPVIESWFQSRDRFQPVAQLGR